MVKTLFSITYSWNGTNYYRLVVGIMYNLICNILIDVGYSSGIAAQLIEALSEAEDLDQLDTSWQVKQLISEAKGFLKQMIRIGGAKENLLITLQIIGDISYAWGDIIDNFTPHMQQGVKKDPSLVSKLRATFLKVGS